MIQTLINPKNLSGYIIGLIVLLGVLIILEYPYAGYIGWWRGVIIAIFTIWVLIRDRIREFIFFGACLSILGSILPWWCAGDVIVYCTSGVDFYNVHLVAFWPTVGFLNSYFSSGNIGLVVIFLATLLVYLIVYKPNFLPYREELVILSSILLIIFVSYQLIKHFEMRISFLSLSSGFWMEDGLVFMLYGSLLLFIASLKNAGVEKISSIFAWIAILIVAITPLTDRLERFYYAYLY